MKIIKKNLNKYNKKIIKYLNNFENKKKKREKETISSNIIRRNFCQWTCDVIENEKNVLHLI